MRDIFIVIIFVIGVLALQTLAYAFIAQRRFQYVARLRKQGEINAQSAVLVAGKNLSIFTHTGFFHTKSFLVFEPDHFIFYHKGNRLFEVPYKEIEKIQIKHHRYFDSCFIHVKSGHTFTMSPGPLIINVERIPLKELFSFALKYRLNRKSGYAFTRKCESRGVRIENC